MATDEHEGSGANAATVDRVIDIAIEQFSRHGYADTKLDAIARASGMSKRMIHYHFGDKQGLYHRALGEAVSRLAMDPGDLGVTSGIPVEGVRLLIEALYDQYVQYPEAVRLITQESVIQSLEPTGQSPVTDLSAISLHLDKLLMVGQDAGAFRPGISTNDVFTIIAALAMYRTTNHDMMENLLGVDMASEANIDGMRHLIVDTVLAFLTSNIPDTGQESYLLANSEDDESEAPSDIYDTDAGIYD